MPVLKDDGAAADDSDRHRCSCLPFCHWGAASGSRDPSNSGGAQAKRSRRRHGLRLRFRFRLRLSWLAWPWFRRSGKAGTGGGGSSEKGERRRRGARRLLLLLTTSLQPKKALASVVSGDSSALLPVPPKVVSSYGDANKKQSNRRPRRPTTVDDAASGSRQPQASSTAATASTGCATAPARSRPPETTSPPRPSDDGPAGAGRAWRAPSRRHSLRQPAGDCSSSSSGGLWTAATTLGVIVLLGRVAAVVFLCSCLYGARFVRAWAAGGCGCDVDGVSSSSPRFGDPEGVVAAGTEEFKKVVMAEMCATDECKKKVVMAGLLDRAGKTPSSRFGR